MTTSKQGSANAAAETAAALQHLLDIMARLRDPDGGCPWDLEQDFASIAPYTIEEAYEVADAIERGNLSELRDELGDLLLQVVFHARMAEEQGEFAFRDVAAAISDKMVRRHPHVFGTAEERDAATQALAWEAQKQAERAAGGSDPSALAGLSRNLPALTLASKTGKRAAGVGFDWPNVRGVLAKIREELDEVEAALAAGTAAQRDEELGDLLLAVTSLARHLEVDPEQALRRADSKFSRRFRALEQSLREAQLDWTECSAAELDTRWEHIKRAERAADDEVED